MRWWPANAVRDALRQKARERLNEYLDGRLTAAAAADVEARLLRYAALRRELDGLGGVRAVLRAQPVEPAPRSFAISVRQAAALQQPDTAGARARGPGLLQVATAAAALVLAVLIGVDAAGVVDGAPAPMAAAPASAGERVEVDALTASPAAGVARQAEPSAAAAAPTTAPAADAEGAVAVRALPASTADEERTALGWAQLVFGALTALTALAAVGVSWRGARRRG